MDIDRKTRMMKLLADPDMRSVLEWYGLPINDRACLRLSLEDFCGANDVDVEDVLVELTVLESDRDGEEEEDDADWLYAY
jgi:hypothetical protein